ncbi:hypothetical protein ES705_07594 [subsurface metagenome]
MVDIAYDHLFEKKKKTKSAEIPPKSKKVQEKIEHKLPEEPITERG